MLIPCQECMLILSFMVFSTLARVNGRLRANILAPSISTSSITNLVFLRIFLRLPINWEVEKRRLNNFLPELSFDTLTVCDSVTSKLVSSRGLFAISNTPLSVYCDKTAFIYIVSQNSWENRLLHISLLKGYALGWTPNRFCMNSISCRSSLWNSAQAYIFGQRSQSGWLV